MGLFDRFKKVDPKPEQAPAPAAPAPTPTPKPTPAQNASQYVYSSPKINELYQKIADTVTDMIPDEWTNLYFYGEVLNDSTTAFSTTGKRRPARCSTVTISLKFIRSPKILTTRC